MADSRHRLFGRIEAPSIDPLGFAMIYGVQDIVRSLTHWRVWSSIALDDVVGRYRRTILGPLWLVLAQLALILGLYFLHRSLMGANSRDYLPYLAAGLPLWALIAAFINDGSQSLLRSKGFAESYPLPIGTYVVRTVAGSFLTFAHLIVSFFLVVLILRRPIEITLLAWIPALSLYAALGLGAGLLLAPLSARYRDLGPALAAFMSLMFVLTPVFWIPNDEQRASPLLQLNPFYHLLEVGRAPLLGEWGAPEHWGVSIVLALAALLIGGAVFARMRRSVVYWL